MIELLKKMYPFIQPYKWQALIAALCSIPIAGIKVAQVSLVRPIFDNGFSQDASFDDALFFAGIIIGLAIINYPLRYLHFYGMRMVVDKATCQIRHRIYSKLQKLSAQYYSESKQGKLLSVMINDTALFAEAFMHGLDLIRSPLTALGMLGYALYIDWQLTFIIFAAAPLFVVIFNFTGKRIRKFVALAQSDTAEMTHHAAEGVTGQKIIKAFNLQNYIVSRFDKAQEQFLGHKQQSNSAEEHSHPAVELVGALAFGSIVIFAHHRITSGSLTTGGFVAFLAAMAMFMDPVRRFSKANTKLNQARAAAQRIFALLDTAEEVNEGTITFKEFKDSIEFKNVTFSYGKGDVLKDVSFKIEKGQKLGLVGLSGSGKSTIISLLLRLYDIQSGEILIDGVNVKDYDLQSLREAFALVSQDIFLFNDTVKENLMSGFDYTDSQIEHALVVSHAKEFVEKLSEKEMTLIGDRGLKLSGGQSQRLTIARAFLRGCPIFLFDEATSALDNESEKIVQEAMDEVAEDKTVIAVAHRLSTIQKYDKILVMKEGRVIQEGAHADLIAAAGEYNKLYELSQHAPS
jgi:subfamily B ATP-binding cassette protein MsbA